MRSFALRVTLLLTVATPLIVSSTLMVSSTEAQTQKAPSATIVELAVQTDALSTLVAAVKAAGLVDTLASKGPFTVFAPTNEAFAKLPEGLVARLLEPGNRDALVRLLTYHVVPGAVDGASLLANRSLTTAAGEDLQIRLAGGRLQINDSRVVENDILASNGVVHLIDTVLIPPQPELSGPNAGKVSLFVLAIERGVPLFNGGDTAGCAAAYEIAVRAVTMLCDDLNPGLKAEFEKTLAQLDRQADSAERAWMLRRVMDRALEQWVDEKMEPASEGKRNRTSDDFRSVFEFDQASDKNRWFTLNDDVMSGISKSRFELTAQGTAKFSGALSLENNGGFATIRATGEDLDLRGYDGFVLRVRGDGRSYGFSALPTDRRFEINNWRTNFQTQAGEWQEIRVPFSSLVHQVMGRKRPETGPLPAEQIRSVSFNISDKDETPFALEIDWIRAYRETTPTKL